MKTVKTFTILSLLSCAKLFATTASAAEKSYEIGAFTGVHVGRGISLEMSKGDSLTAIAKTRKEDFSDLVIKVEDSILKVTRDGLLDGENNIYFTVAITAPDLNLNFVKASTGGELNASDVNIEDGEIYVNTGGTAYVSGTCGSIYAKASTGGVLKAKNLKCRRIKAKGRTGGEMTVFASEKIEAYARMGAIVRVYGDPAKVDKGTFLGGEVRIKK